MTIAYSAPNWNQTGEAAHFRLESGTHLLMEGDIPADMTLDRTDLLKGGTFRVAQYHIDHLRCSNGPSRTILSHHAAG